ncbi:MAG: cytochrome c [Burkholderiaceae bacterium]|nr:cytochrome c [Burkholderiaceae bacterium]
MTWLRKIGFYLALAASLLATQAAQAADTTMTDSLIKKGEYLATAGDCIACHTAPRGKPFAGGLLLSTPVGNIVATNITPSKTHGIGDYTLEDFTRAMRKGVAKDGHYLYPAMPYTAYAQVSDEDIAAIYAYFMKAVEPVDESAPATQLPFPFNVRQSMALWNFMFLDNSRYQADDSKDDLWNRGAYLARGLAHCSTCHTPRSVTMAEDLSRRLGGEVVGGWFAPNITSDPVSGIGGWTQEEIVTYMKTGRVEGKSQAAGPMAEAIDHSLRHLTDEDLKAMAVYLKTVPPVSNKNVSKAAYSFGGPTHELPTIRGVDLPANQEQWTGAQLYDAHCATCHLAQGQGSRGLPSLFHNTALGWDNSNNLVMAVLQGIERQGHGDAMEVVMPAFARDLSDKQVAMLSTYVLAHYGNPDAVVTLDQVKSLRSGVAEGPDLIKIARIAMGVGVLLALIVLAGVVVWWRRRRHR